MVRVEKNKKCSWKVRNLGNKYAEYVSRYLSSKDLENKKVRIRMKNF